MSHPTGPPHHWRDDALCRRYDPERWFPVGATGPAVDQTINAKLICKQCPSLGPCLTTALSDLRLEGVWGNTTHDERKEFVRNVRRRAQREVLVSTVRRAVARASAC